MKLLNNWSAPNPCTKRDGPRSALIGHAMWAGTPLARWAITQTRAEHWRKSGCLSSKKSPPFLGAFLKSTWLRLNRLSPQSTERAP